MPSCVCLPVSLFPCVSPHDPCIQECHGDWLAVQHGTVLAQDLKARFEVTGIPSLVVVNRSGDTEGTAGRNIVQQQRENNVYKEKTQMCGVHLWLDQDKKEPIENQERRTSIKAFVYYTGLKPNSHKAKKAKPEFLKIWKLLHHRTTYPDWIQGYMYSLGRRGLRVSNSPVSS